MYNDVWAYDLKCERYFDGPCEGSGWTILHPGALQGGCSIQLGTEVCTVPSERYNHGAVFFEDGLMYIYGGISQRCGDYCDDMWVFDIYMKAWRNIYTTGKLSHLPGFYTDDTLGSKGYFGGPGKRWKPGMVCVNDTLVIFGGHRLWHGYAKLNSEDNDWLDYSEYPSGGYLDDFWVYIKEIDYITESGSEFKKTEGKWYSITAKEYCYSSKGITWESR